MFCQKCGSQLPDDAKFCTTCGAVTDAKQPEQGTAAGTGESAPYQPPNQATGAQGAYTPPPYTQQQGYAQQPYYGYQQPPYGPQRPYAPYGAPGVMPRRSITAATWVVLLGGILAILGFFLPFMSFGGAGMSFMDSLINNFSIETLPFIAFLLSGILALIFAFAKPSLAIICFLLSLGGCIYIFVTIIGQLMPYMQSFDFGMILQFMGVGVYLTAASILFLLIGSIMGMGRK
ncbi:MAG: zinc ribbon domain-containing protein [Christensenellales bacterium]